MASASDGHLTGPFWSAEEEQHYWYDSLQDVLVFQNGLRIRRPADVPRTALMPPTALQYNFSPSTAGNYTTAALRPSGNAAGAAAAAPGSGTVANLSTAVQGLSLGGVASRQPAAGTVATPSASRPGQQTSSWTSPDGVTTRLENIEEGKIVDVFNAQNQVKTRFQTGPASEITDQSLLQTGRSAYRMLVPTGSEGDTEQLFPTFRVRSNPRRFFAVGTVFMVLWSEPAGETNTRITGGITAGIPPRTPGITQGRHGEKVFSKVRRFVVIREGLTYCSALPITTYGSQGVGKPGVTKSEHAIIHTGRNAPEPMSSEKPVRGEVGMRPEPIRVEPDDREDKLDPRSRIDFGKVHTIQHNIKVRSYGNVHERSMQALQKQFNLCWYSASVPVVSSSTTPAQGPSRGHTDTRTPATARRDSVSSDNRSQRNRGSGNGGSQSGQPSRDPRHVAGERQSIAREQELQRQQYWAAVEQLRSQHGYSREQAMETLNTRLAQRRAAAARRNRDGDDDDDDDD